MWLHLSGGEEIYMEKQKGKYDIAVLVISYIVLVAFNALSEALELGGVTAGDVSNEVFAWFAPAGYVFSIWGGDIHWPGRMGHPVHQGESR